MAVVGNVDEVAPGEIKAFDVEGVRVAVANGDGMYHAFYDYCTHQQCSLSADAELHGLELTCLCHFSVFDITTGQVLDGPAEEPLPIFEVLVVDGALDVRI